MDNELDLKEKEIEKKMEDHKEEEKRRFPPFLILFLLTTIVTLAALGLSFSAIELLESNETINTIISTLRGEDDKNKFVIFYSENINTGSGGGSALKRNRIYLVDQFPTPDSQGKLFKGDFYVFDFTLIVGKKTAGAYYEITAEELMNNNLNPSYVKLYLTKNGREVDFSFKDNKKVKVYTDYIKSNYPGTKGRVIYKDFISEDDAKRGKIEFRLRMWVSEDVMVDDEYYNKRFGVTVNTYASFTVDYDR